MKYKRHPKQRDVYVREDGQEVLIDKKPRKITRREPKGYPLMVVNINCTEVSLARLVLETYGSLSKTDRKYFAKCIDGNIENTNPNNLKWVTRTCKELTETKILKRACKASVLPNKCLVDIFNGYTKLNKSLAHYAKIFSTSETTIARAIKRYKRMKQLNLI